MSDTLLIEHEVESDGRHIAEIPALPGCVVYGATKREALSRVVALAMDIEGEPPTTGRDPRVDPKPGDVLVGAYRTRTVTLVGGGWTDEPHVFWRGKGDVVQRSTLYGWRKWTKHARVETVAP